MTFSDTVRFLYNLGHELKHVKWDLARIRAVLAELGDPHLQPRFIHVAGTNGKGSTCAMIASGLLAAGFRTGVYTSPHLVDPRERIQIGGAPIGEAAWITFFEQVHAACERLLAREQIDEHPSFFETITAMAFLAFARERVEVVSLETGLGGRLDATNVVDPEVSVITPIDFDHEAFLGSSIESIAAEKAGILKRDRPAIVAVQRPEALRVLEARALELDVPITHSASLRIEDLEMHRYGSRFRLISDEIVAIECPLAGAHQVENARVAAAAMLKFGLSAPVVSAGIAHAKWPGRLERAHARPDLILDGAHNPAGAKALAAYIREFFPNEPVRIIYGAMRDKAVDEVTATLFPLAAEVIVTAPDQPRALAPEALAAVVEHPNLRCAPNLAAALHLASQHPMATFITGSLFLVGEAKARL